MIAQTNHQTTKNATENKWHGDLFTNGENLTTKTPLGDFQVTTPKTPLLTQQAVTSKGILSTLPTYSWTLTLIPNWTCSVVTVPLFDARPPSTWLTNWWIPIRDFNHQLRRFLVAKFFSSSTRWRLRSCLITKPNGAHTQQLHHKNDELGQEFHLRSQFAWTEFSQCLCNLQTSWRPLK